MSEDIDCIIEMEPLREPLRNGRVVVLCHTEQKCGTPYAGYSCGFCGTILVRGEMAKIRQLLWKCPCGWLNEVK